MLKLKPRKIKTAKVGDVIVIPNHKGLFVVERAVYEGGSRGGGMSGHDDYPDALHITARKLGDRGGYQKNGRTLKFTMDTNCYSDVIEGIVIHGKMERRFV